MNESKDINILRRDVINEAITSYENFPDTGVFSFRDDPASFRKLG